MLTTQRHPHNALACAILDGASAEWWSHYSAC